MCLDGGDDDDELISHTVDSTYSHRPSHSAAAGRKSLATRAKVTSV